jgi:hypothetical protein
MATCRSSRVMANREAARNGVCLVEKMIRLILGLQLDTIRS